MSIQLDLLAAAQGGLITRRQMIGAGVREPQLRSLTRANGPYVAIRRGVYVQRRRWIEAREATEGQARLRDRAAHLAMEAAHLMSHDSAARAWGLPLVGIRVELVHVTREGVGGSRTECGVKHHLTRLGLLNTERVDSMTVTSLARTAVDVAREHGLATGLVACDAALRSGLDLRDLQAELAVMRHWRGVVAAREAVELADSGAESPGESLTRLLVVGLGLGVVQTQFPVARPNGVAWADLRVGRHLVEFDGRVKFQRGGPSRGSVEDALWEERIRQNDLMAAGFGVSRVTWDELMPGQRHATGARLAAEFRLSHERFGDELSVGQRNFAASVAGERSRRLRGDRRLARSSGY